MAAASNKLADRDGRAQQARDVMAFGHQHGRVLSDGTIIGRAEPFTKVFPSSRAVKRQVGLTAWAILEDIALDARIDDQGRLVAETNVRRIADNLALSKNTVSNHLKTLREAGFTVREETRTDSGAWGASRYVLDPSACLERFTTTPTQERDGSVKQQAEEVVENLPAGGNGQPTEAVDNSPGGSPDRPNDAEFGGLSPCTSSWDTAPVTVSQFMGHQEVGHNNQEHACRKDQPLQQHARQGERVGETGGCEQLLQALLAVDVELEIANTLLDNHPLPAILDALTVVAHREVENPAGWVLTAVREGWDLAEEADELRDTQRRRQRKDQQAQDQAQQRRKTEAGLARAEGWHAVISAALDDAQLTDVVGSIAADLSEITATSVPVIRAELTRLAAAAWRTRPTQPLADVLLQEVAVGRPPNEPSPELPEPPPLPQDAPSLGERIRRLINAKEPVVSGSAPVTQP